MDVIKGPADLEREVLKENLCTTCGACVGLCPYFSNFQGRVVMMESCKVTQGRCYAFCPRTTTDLEDIYRFISGRGYEAEAIGPMREIFMARATDRRSPTKRQYGGVVTTLMAFALEKGLVNAAAMVAPGDQLLPEVTLLSNSKEVFGCAGTRYVVTPVLEAFNRGARGEKKRLGVVGLPCQVLALSKMRLSPLENKNNIHKLQLVIGLFCTWALPYKEFSKFIKKEMKVDGIKKFDIPPPPANIFQVFKGKEKREFPLDEIRPMVRPTCQVCLDMTAELSDLSVGAVEGVRGWNTVIVRTEKGKELIESVLRKGLIRKAPLPEAIQSHLMEASTLKRKRAIKNLIERTGNRQDLLYIKLRQEVVEKILSS
jgi:coenzyme F420 hydrogenase subunit beta